MNRAVFLDRDGVVNVERGDYTYTIAVFTFTEGLFETLRRFQAAGYLLIVITNQGGIAKGRYTLQEFEALTEWMCSELEKEGIHIADVFFSPHHDEFGESLDRKPDSLMLERAIHRYKVDPSTSVMIGDSERDIFAAERAGVRGILITPNAPLHTIEAKILHV